MTHPPAAIDRYQLLEPLGQGGMAVVYKAYDTRLERVVAVKLIRKDAFPVEVHDRILKRFEREAKVLARMAHPNVVKVFDSGEFNGAPYLVMDFISGRTLRDQPKPLKFQQAIGLILPVAQALNHAHQHGILHRDVKPSNILIGANGKPMLADFGIAKLLDQDDGHTLTGTGVGIGTPEYMAPEQGLGQEVDGRADEYALGVVFYELLTGQKPFTADTPVAVVIKQIHDPVPLPSQINPDVPKHVEAFLLKALAKNPEDRYADMGAFIAALETIQNLEIDLLKASSDVSPSHENWLLEQQSGLKTRSLPLTGDTATQDLLSPESEPLPVKPLQKTGRKRRTSYVFVLAGLIGMVGLGIGLVSNGVSELKTPISASPEEVPALSGTRFPEPTSSPWITPTLATESPLQNPSAKPENETFAPDVIQINNILQLAEIHRWSSEENWYRDMISWKSDSAGFFLTNSHAYGYSLYDLNSLLVQNFGDDMSYQYMAALSPINGYYAITDSSDSQFEIWQHEGNEKNSTISGSIGSPYSSPAFSPDGQMLAGILDESLNLWDANDGHQVHSLERNLTDAPWVGVPTVLVFSPDSKTLAAGNPLTGEIKLWDVDSGTLLQTLHWHEGLSSLCFSPDGKTLASGGRSVNHRDIIRLWDVEEGLLRFTIQKSNESASSIAYSIDGQVLISGSTSGTLRVWRVSDGALIKTLYSTADKINQVSVSPDGKHLVSVGEEVIWWGIQTQQPIH